MADARAGLQQLFALASRKGWRHVSAAGVVVDHGETAHVFQDGAQRIIVIAASKGRAPAGDHDGQIEHNRETSILQAARSTLDARGRETVEERAGDLPSDVLIEQVGRWMSDRSKNVDVDAEHEAARKSPRTEVLEAIEAAADTKWPYEPNGYPRLHPERLGWRLRRKAEMLTKNGRLPQRPPAHEDRWFESTRRTFDTAEALAIGVALAGAEAGFVLSVPETTAVIGLAAGGVGIFAVVIGGSLGLVHRRIARFLNEVTGGHWDNTAVEYVPWVDEAVDTHDVSIAELRELQDGLRYDARTYLELQRFMDSQSSRRAVPRKTVGRDCAIVLVAERIGKKICEYYQILDAEAGGDVSGDRLNVAAELHEIAWAVADLMKFKATRNAAGEHPMNVEDRTKAIQEFNSALIGRVAALRSRADQLAAQVTGLRAQQARDRELWLQMSPQDGPDLAPILANAEMQRQAAERIAGDNYDPPAVGSPGVRGINNVGPDGGQEGVDGLSEVDLTEADRDIITMLQGANFGATSRVVLPSGKQLSGAEMMPMVSSESMWHPRPSAYAAAAESRYRHPGDHTVPATLEQYLQWLHGYFARHRGPVKARDYGYPFERAEFRYATADIVVDSENEFGANSRRIIVPAGCSTRPSNPAARFFEGWGHTDLYLMDGFKLGHGTPWPALYSDPEFAPFKAQSEEA